jgi:AraC-like DNA-binding protein
MPKSTRPERTKFWREPGLNNLELLHADYVTHAFLPHTHEGFAIGVIETGAETFDYRQEHHIAPAGSIVLINPGEPHTGQGLTANGWAYRMLYPDAELMQRVASQWAGCPRDVPFFPQPVIYDDALAAQILKLHTVLEKSSVTLERESSFWETFGLLIARHADDRSILRPQPDDVRSVREAQDYLNTHFSEDLSLNQLAQAVQTSPFHLLRTFRRIVGLTPHAYLIQVRVQQAKRLLLTPSSITQIAFDTGFTDQSHLTRRFKQIVGVTPGQYRYRPEQ